MRNVARTQKIAVLVVGAAEVDRLREVHQFPPSPLANGPVLSVRSILRAQFPAAHTGTTYLPTYQIGTTYYHPVVRLFPSDEIHSIDSSVWRNWSNLADLEINSTPHFFSFFFWQFCDV
jgi:hypothetical protein